MNTHLASHPPNTPDALAPDALAREVRRLSELCQTATQFVDHVSHEFRTPLTVIKDACSLIYDGLLGPVSHEQREYLQTTLARIDDLACLVDDMLDISKIEAGQLGLWRQTTDVATVIGDVQRLVARRAAARGLKLEVAVDDGLPAIYCDPENVRRALANLLINAIKFTPPDGQITAWAKRDDDPTLIRFGVTDTGAGIRPERLSMLFERFQQAGFHGRSNASLKGFGLGLSIVRELVHLNLGAVRVESQLGHGTTFSFTMPIDEPAAVFERYLEQLAADSSDAAPRVTLVQATTDQPINDTSVLEEMDEFLHTCGRGCDIVFRRPNGWLMAISDGMAEASVAASHVGKLQTEWRSLNENRPRGKLPEFVFQTCGSWSLATERPTLKAEFAKQPEPAAIQPVRPAADKPRQILLVDDEEDVLRAISVRLRAAGYQVIAALDGREGMEAAIKHQPDAIVLDVCMPEMDGFRVLDGLRRNESTTAIPVVMLSASVRDQQQALQHGARFFIQKPYDSKNLLTALQTTIGAKP